MNLRGTLVLSVLMIVGLAASPATHPATAPATRPAKPAFNTGQHVQVKWGLTWRNASINNKRGEWFLITYDPGRTQEWVENWRVRNSNSKEDPIGYAKPNGLYRKGDAPPTDKPGDPPEPIGMHAANPHEPNPPSARQAPEQEKQEEATVPTTQPDLSTCHELSLTSPAAGAPAPDAESATPALFKDPIALSADTAGAARDIESLVVSDASHAVAVVTFADAAAFKTRKSSVDRIDLATGKITSMPLPVSDQTDDLSPDGNYLLTHRYSRSLGENDRIDLWQIDADKPQHIVSFKPYDSAGWAERDIRQARFVDGNHFLTIGANAQLILWDARATKALWSVRLRSTDKIALSANHKYLAFSDDKFVKIFDAITGKLLSQYEYPPATMQGGALAFSPDGKQLACLAGSTLLIWDLKTHQVIHQTSLDIALGSSVDWAQYGFLLLDHQYLVSPELEMIVWRYEQSRGLAAQNLVRLGGQFCHLTDPQKPSRALAPMVLPTPDAKAAAANPKSDVFLLAPGTKVSLETSVPGELQQQIVAGITKLLAANGVTIADNQPIKVKASINSGDPQDVTYTHMGTLAADVKMSVPTWVSKLEIVDADGKTAFVRTGKTYPPMMPVPKKGQSVEDAVNSQNKPNAALFENARIPKYLPRPGQAPGFGSTILD